MVINGQAVKIAMPFDGYIIGVSIWSSEEITGGTVTVYPLVNDIAQSGHVLSLTSDTTNYVFHGDIPCAFWAGDELSLGISSDEDLTPDGTADIRACLWIAPGSYAAPPS